MDLQSKKCTVRNIASLRIDIRDGIGKDNGFVVYIGQSNRPVGPVNPRSKHVIVGPVDPVDYDINFFIYATKNAKGQYVKVDNKNELTDSHEIDENNTYSVLFGPTYTGVCDPDLIDAIKHGTLDDVTTELDKVTRVNAGDAENKDTPLHHAMSHGNIDIVKELLNIGADVDAVNQDWDTPLHNASANGHDEVVEVLLDKESGRLADMKAVNQDWDTPLHNASANGHDEVVEVLLDKESGRLADMKAVNKDGDTPLHLASANGHDAVVGVLLDHGADMKAVNEEKQTPLHSAVVNGNNGWVIELLLDKESGRLADVNAADKDGDTPLHIASQLGYDAVAKQLLIHEADVDARNKADKTPLHLASSYGHRAVVKVLLDTGRVDVKAVDKYGNTPLHYAVVDGNIGVELLLRAAETLSVSAD
jgi:ankyrin repeat protein